MRTATFLTAITLLGAGFLATDTQAQRGPRGPWHQRGQSPAQNWQTPGADLSGILDAVPPEARAKLRDAAQKAEQRDEVKQARERLQDATRAYRDTWRNAVTQIDPSLSDALSKIGEAREKMARRRDAKPAREATANLPPEQREKLQKAVRQAHQDPAVKAAREKIRSATDRRAAFQELAKTYRDAIVKADPSLKETVEKMGPMLQKRFQGRIDQFRNAGTDRRAQRGMMRQGHPRLRQAYGQTQHPRMRQWTQQQPGPGPRRFQQPWMNQRGLGPRNPAACPRWTPGTPNTCPRGFCPNQPPAGGRGPQQQWYRSPQWPRTPYAPWAYRGGYQGQRNWCRQGAPWR